MLAETPVEWVQRGERTRRSRSTWVEARDSLCHAEGLRARLPCALGPKGAR